MRIVIISLILMCACSGCASVAGARIGVSAEPLSVLESDVRNPPTNKKDFISSVTFESGAKCVRFLNQLTEQQASLNTSSDLVALLFSTAGAVTTPASVANALSAVSALATGTKNIINTNYFNNAGFAAFQIALQRTYFLSMAKYLNILDQSDERSLILGAEITKVHSIHAMCSIAAAQASILATIQPERADENVPPAVLGAAAGAAAGATAGANAGAAAGATAGAAVIAAAAAAPPAAPAVPPAAAPAAPPPAAAPATPTARSLPLFVPGSAIR